MKSTVATNSWTIVFLSVASALKVCCCCLVFGAASPVPAAAWASLAQQVYVKASNTETLDWFGSAVAISGDTMVVGAPREDSNATGVNGNQSNNNALDSGAAYVFVRSGDTWVQQAYLKASNTEAGDRFGYSVAVAGDTVVVGAIGEASTAIGVNGHQSDNSATNAGAAYVFVRSGTNWSQQAYLKASNTAANDVFGRAVAVSGETIAVGAFGEDSNATGVNGVGTDPRPRLRRRRGVCVRAHRDRLEPAGLSQSIQHRAV